MSILETYTKMIRQGINMTTHKCNDNNLGRIRHIVSTTKKKRIRWKNAVACLEYLKRSMQ